MSKIVSGVFNGLGAAGYLCFGFIPDRLRIVALEDDAAATVHWSRNFRAADCDNGFVDEDGATAHVLYTAGNGVEPYYGGDEMTTANQTSVTYGEGVFIQFNRQDYRISNIDASRPGDGSGSTIDKWTLGSSANRTGNFNADVIGTYISEGSKIVIDGKTYTIEALTATQGIAANEVTLNQSPASGDVEFIGGMYDLAPVPIGKIAPAGVKINMTSLVNVNDEMQYFEAVKFDTID